MIALYGFKKIKGEKTTIDNIIIFSGGKVKGARLLNRIMFCFVVWDRKPWCFVVKWNSIALIISVYIYIHVYNPYKAYIAQTTIKL